MAKTPRSRYNDAPTDLLGRVNQSNGRLRAGQIGIRIEIRNNRFYLRGSLPPRSPTGGADFQQVISTGILANIPNLPAVERLAKRVAVEVGEGSFNWQNYAKSQRPAPDPKARTFKQAVSEFEEWYRTTRPNSKGREKTWAKDYGGVLQQLPRAQNLGAEPLIELLKLSEPGSRTRQRQVNALQMFARWAGIDVDLSDYRIKARNLRIDPRSLPTDSEIESAFDLMASSSSEWAMIFGLMAVYGIRPGETWFADLDSLSSSPALLTVTAGKTGPRSSIFPIWPEWVERFSLLDRQLPPMTQNKEPGTPVSRKFKEIGIRFQPYALRHAWAGRAAKFGVDTGSAAIQMGHSVKIHLDYYSHWYNERHQREVFAILTARRPGPGQSPINPHSPNPCAASLGGNGNEVSARQGSQNGGSGDFVSSSRPSSVVSGLRG